MQKFHYIPLNPLLIEEKLNVGVPSKKRGMGVK